MLKAKRPKADKPTTLPRRYKPGFMRQLDQRSEISRRLNASYDTIVAECGGADNLTHTRLAMVERFCFLEAMLQTWEAQLADNPKDADQLVGKWIQAVNSLTGLAKMIGLERRLPASTLDLQTYLAQRNAKEAG